MSRTATRWLMIPVLLIIVALVGIAVLVPPAAVNPADPNQNGLLFLAYLLMVLAGLVLVVIALVGALIKLNQLKRYGWFFTLLGSAALVVVTIGLVLTPLMLLIYSFFGPTTPAPARA